MKIGTDAPVAVDIFAGAGGLSEGLLSAGFNVAVAVEKHPHAALTHAFNHSDTHVICGDIREVTAAHIRSQVLASTGQSSVDLLAGGPPCQGFSPAGKQNRSDPRNKLPHEFVRLVRQLKPKAFLFENVPGLAKLYDSDALHRILDSFWHLGYSIFGIDEESEYYPTEFPILNAASYGVPQRRKRLILLGIKDCETASAMSWPRRATASLEPDSVVSVHDAISDLSFLTCGLECHGYSLDSSTTYQAQRRKNSETLFNHLATQHRKETISMFRKIGAGKTIRSVPAHQRSGKQRMRRLVERDASPAVLALPDDYLHYRRHRILTVREMARLQSFDDDYVFLGKRTTSDLSRRHDVPQYTQVGNAVPPLLARAIGRSLLKALGAPSSDLRDLARRRNRHQLVLGTSGYEGYSLLGDARDEVVIYGAKGGKLPVPRGRSDNKLMFRPYRWEKISRSKPNPGRIAA